MNDADETNEVDPVEFLKRALAISPEDAAQVREDAAKRKPDVAAARGRDRARARFEALGLIGMDLDQARAAVEAAGGEFKVKGEGMSFKLDHNRVWVAVEDGKVTEFWTG
jgi:hypothetical protein